ncbi:hypothetical protein ACQBAU_08680 [Propionibacteriaceae bacterium Y2011]
MTATDAPAESPPTDSPERKQRRRALLFNSVLAAFAGLTAMIMVHEFVHLVAGAALGFPSTMVAFAVDHVGSPTPVEYAIMALSAPAFSLVSGLAMTFWLPFRRRGGFPHLLWLFFAFCSTQEGVTYLVITPFGVGDTGSSMQVLGAPVWVSILLCLIGVGGMFLNARLFAPHLIRHAGTETGDRNALGLFAWLFGMLLQTAFTFLYLTVAAVDLPPGDQIAVIMASMGVLVFAPMANIFARVKGVADQPYEPLTLPRIPVAGLVVSGVLVVTNIVLCVVGLALG